jgi:hypothetical protein
VSSRRAGGAPGGGARSDCAPDDGGSLNRRGRAGYWVDADHGLYRRRDSPSPDRSMVTMGFRPILTKTNYVELAAVMRVRLQLRHMFEAVRYGDVDYYEDRWTLDALITVGPPEMQFSLSKKRFVKEAWSAIAATRIGNDRACKTTLQALRKEWENLAFRPGEDVDDFALHLNTLLYKMV